MPGVPVEPYPLGSGIRGAAGVAADRVARGSGPEGRVAGYGIADHDIADLGGTGHGIIDRRFADHGIDADGIADGRDGDGWHGPHQRVRRGYDRDPEQLAAGR